jgi:hypothetical protein
MPAKNTRAPKKTNKAKTPIKKKAATKVETPAGFKKLVIFDDETADQIAAAVSLLGLDDMKFIRLSVRKSLENILGLYRDAIEESARKYVNEIAYIYYRSPQKKGELRLKLNSSDGLKGLEQALSTIYPSVEDVDKALSRMEEYPLELDGPLKFTGNRYERMCAPLLLGRTTSHVAAGRNMLRLELENLFKSSVGQHVEKWKSLTELQNKVIHTVYDNPAHESEEEKVFKKQIEDITNAEDALIKDQEPSGEFMLQLKRFAQAIWEEWAKLDSNAKLKKLGQWKSKSAVVLKNKRHFRQQQADQLDSLKQNPSRWLNPIALQDMLAPESKSILATERPGWWFY